jgi:hypothetical protein
MSDGSCGVHEVSKLGSDERYEKLMAALEAQQKIIEVLKSQKTEGLKPGGKITTKNRTSKRPESKNVAPVIDEEAQEKMDEAIDDEINRRPQGHPEKPQSKKSGVSQDASGRGGRPNQQKKVEAPTQDKILDHRTKEDGSVECHVVTLDGGKEWVSRERAYSLWFEEFENYVKDWNKVHKKKEEKLTNKKGWKPPEEKHATEVVELIRVVRDTTVVLVDGVETRVDGQWMHVIYQNGYACWSKVEAVHEEYGTLFDKFMEDGGWTWDETKKEVVKN